MNLQAKSGIAFLLVIEVECRHSLLDVGRSQEQPFRLGDWGRFGFDAGNKVLGACREGSQSRKSKAANLQLPMMTTTVPN